MFAWRARPHFEGAFEATSHPAAFARMESLSPIRYCIRLSLASRLSMPMACLEKLALKVNYDLFPRARSAGPTVGCCEQR